MQAPKEIRPEKVAIYIRWSTEDQSEGTTLIVQQEACQHYVLSQGWRVTPSLIYIDDGYSGGTLDRPRMTDLRTAIRVGDVDCVVVYKLDRLSRSVMDTVNLVLGEWEGRTFLKSAKEPVDTTSAMGKQFFYMLVSYAEWERSVIRERTFSGKLRRAKEGRSPGGPVPYGYRLSGQAGILDLDPAQAAIIKRIYREYLEEVGTYRICDRLNQDGIPSPTGTRWNVNTLLKMLRNPLYAGRLTYGKLSTNPRRQRDKSEPWYLKNDQFIDTASQNPTIISVTEFERVQQLLERRGAPKVGVRALSSDYLLTGLLTCGKCGHPLVSHSSSRHGNAKLYEYYLCNGKKTHGATSCDAGLIPQLTIDDLVERKLRQVLESETAYLEFIRVRWASIEAQLSATVERHQHVAVSLERLSAQTKRLNRDYRAGDISARLYEENHKEIDTETLQLREQLSALNRLERSLTSSLQERDVTQQIFDLAKRWREITVPERKFVLRNLLDQVVAYKAPRTTDLVVEVRWKFSEISDGVRA